MSNTDRPHQKQKVNPGICLLYNVDWGVFQLHVYIHDHNVNFVTFIRIRYLIDINNVLYKSNLKQREKSSSEMSDNITNDIVMFNR